MNIVWIVTWIVSQITCNHFGPMQRNCLKSDHETYSEIKCMVFKSSETARGYYYGKIASGEDSVKLYEAVEK